MDKTLEALKILEEQLAIHAVADFSADESDAKVRQAMASVHAAVKDTIRQLGGE